MHDSGNNAIQYFISSDGGYNFIYKGVILSAETNSSISTYFSMYQAVPLKVNDEWLLYASGGFRNYNTNRKNGIALFAGRSLDKLNWVQGGFVTNRKYLDVSPVLTNNHTISNKYYGTYYNTVNGEYNGYGMNFGDTLRAPAWVEGSGSSARYRPIVYVFDDIRDPYIVPDYPGIIWRNINTNAIWLSVNNNSIDDWLALSGGAVINNQLSREGVSEIINVKGVYRLVINQGTGTISNLVGGKDGQELFLVVVPTAENVTLSNGASGEGSIRLKDGSDLTLRRNEGISLININDTWYQK